MLCLSKTAHTRSPLCTQYAFKWHPLTFLCTKYAKLCTIILVIQVGNFSRPSKGVISTQTKQTTQTTQTTQTKQNTKNKKSTFHTFKTLITIKLFDKIWKVEKKAFF